METIVIVSLLLATTGFVVCVYLLYQVLRGKRKTEGRKESHIPISNPEAKKGKGSALQKILGKSKTNLEDYFESEPEVGSEAYEMEREREEEQKKKEEEKQRQEVIATPENMEELGVSDDDLAETRNEEVEAEGQYTITALEQRKLAYLAQQENITPKEEEAAFSIYEKLKDTVFAYDLGDYLLERQKEWSKKFSSVPHSKETEDILNNKVASLIAKDAAMMKKSSSV